MGIPFNVLMQGQGSYLAMDVVPAAGYRWQDELPDGADGADPGPWLVEAEAATPGSRLSLPLHSRYRNDPGLHRTFAGFASAQTPGAWKANVLRFANKYGRLGGSTSDGHESLTWWRQEVEAMAALIALWDLVRNGASDAERLSHYVRWSWRPTRVSVEVVCKDGRLSPKGVRQMRESMAERQSEEDRWAAWKLCAGSGPQVECDIEQGCFYSQPIACAGGKGFPAFGERLLEDWTLGDVVEPARFFLFTAVTAELGNHVHTTLLPPKTTREGSGCILQIPDSLRAALYLRFARELTGEGLPARECEWCHTLFVPTRKDQRYCPKQEGRDSCMKTASYHRRKNTSTA